MEKNYFIGDPPLGVVYVGYERGQWPLRIFSDPEHTAAWMADKPGYRYAWCYELADPAAVGLVPEVRTPATLKPKAQEGP